MYQDDRPIDTEEGRYPETVSAETPVAGRASKAHNSFFMLAGQFAGKGTLFLSVMILSRYLTDVDFGAILFSIVLGQVYLLFSDMGVALIINMRSSVRPSESQTLLASSLTLRAILAILGLPLLILSGVLLGMSHDRLILLAIIGLSVVFESFSELFYSIFRSREKMLYESISRIVMGFTGLSAVFILTNLGAGLIVIALSYVLRTVAAVALSAFFIIREGFAVRFSRDAGTLRKLLIASLPLGVMGILVVAHQRADNIIIRQMLGENAVAAWQQCLRIVEILILLVVPTLLPGALFPSLCRAFRNGQYSRQTGDMARVFTMMALVPAMMIVSTGGRTLRYIWGPGYLRGIGQADLQLCLYLSLAGLLVVYLMNIMIDSLLAVNKIRVVVPVTFSALLLVIAGNIVLIPGLGLPSAGILFVAGNLLILLSYWVFLRWRGYSLPIWRETFLSILAAVPAAAVLPLSSRLPFLAALLLPVAVYIPVWWFTGGRRAVARLFPLAVEG